MNGDQIHLPQVTIHGQHVKEGEQFVLVTGINPENLENGGKSIDLPKIDQNSIGGGKSYLDTISSTAGFKLEPLSKKGGLGDQLGNTTLLIGQKAHGGSEQQW